MAIEMLCYTSYMWMYKRATKTVSNGHTNVLLEINIFGRPLVMRCCLYQECLIVKYNKIMYVHTL